MLTATTTTTTMMKIRRHRSLISLGCSSLTSRIIGRRFIADLVLVKRDSQNSKVAIVELNDPERLNALSVEMGKQFESAIATLRSDSDVRAVVVTGSGRAFSAGGDMEFLNQRSNAEHTSGDDNARTMLAFYSHLLCVQDLPVPVLAAINGPAVGAGLCFTLACDVRIAAEDARMGFNFVRLGLHPGMACTHFLPMLIGHQKAAEMLLTGNLVSGAEAARIGLVSRALPSGEVLDASLQMARTMAQASPLAVRTTVLTLRAQRRSGLENALIREADAQTQCYSSPEFREGLRAISEKRPPQF
eukprot:NODE_2852_length_1105_cov_62.191288_g2616_i0.p1 GENE.NODE_2852_length_1105_cov_62.191288_g2616_i0~~NODE_2852_length_1105_cov_62.191288_g2616_i0.p1  ORF type:complete len:302 (-),score=46.53 NODE_2852_length_1105_cov_62.191288_g2616_i0:136-1041(-)